VIDAFVNGLAMAELGFERAEAADPGRPGYDPRDLLKLYLYGYLHQLRSWRLPEAECRRNVELMWLLGRLYPDHKSIAEFRRMHREAVIASGAELVRFARSVGLIRGEWIAVDGTRFRALASSERVREREALRRYLDQMESADAEPEATIDNTAVQTAIEKLRQHPEPEARFMPVAGPKARAYNVQTAVDSEHALIVTQQVTLESGDNNCLERMAQVARVALEAETPIHILEVALHADAAAHAQPPHGRRRAEPYTPTRHSGNHAAQTIHGRVPLRDTQVPHLRSPALPAPRLGRLSYRNKPRGNGLQHQADGQPTRRNNPNLGATAHLGQNHQL
jgi:transposase